MLQQIVFHILCSRGIEWILRIFPHSQNGIAAEQVDDVESAESIGARFPVVEGAVAADELLYLVPVQVHVVRHAELEVILEVKVHVQSLETLPPGIGEQNNLLRRYHLDVQVPESFCGV